MVWRYCGAASRGSRLRSYGVLRGTLLTFGRPRFLCYHSQLGYGTYYGKSQTYRDILALVLFAHIRTTLARSLDIACQVRLFAWSTCRRYIGFGPSLLDCRGTTARPRSRFSRRYRTPGRGCLARRSGSHVRLLVRVLRAGVRSGRRHVWRGRVRCRRRR
jgi:hypothetical protein